MEENDFAAIWLAERGNPAVEELAQLNLNVANKTVETLNANNLPADELAVALDINPDEINRWLAGKHTFSMKIINEIQDIMAKYRVS
jgi:hypothetical protein